MVNKMIMQPPGLPDNSLLFEPSLSGIFRLFLFSTPQCISTRFSFNSLNAWSMSTRQDFVTSPLP